MSVNDYNGHLVVHESMELCWSEAELIICHAQMSRATELG